MIKGVPPWIDTTAGDWGREMRRFEKRITAVQGTMGRIREEGPVGAAIREFRDHLPKIDFMDDQVAKFHMAWIDLDTKERAYVWVHFKEHGKVKDKLKRLDTKINDYYDTLRMTLCRISADWHCYDS